MAISMFSLDFSEFCLPFLLSLTLYSVATMKMVKERVLSILNVQHNFHNYSLLGWNIMLVWTTHIHTHLHTWPKSTTHVHLFYLVINWTLQPPNVAFFLTLMCCSSLHQSSPNYVKNSIFYVSCIYHHVLFMDHYVGAFLVCLFKM